MQIINLLAAFPDRGFSLTEIARATEVNGASCHAILVELEQCGYLSRHAARKTYSLGPVLVAAGASAMLANPVLSRAEAAGGRLRNSLGLPVMLTTAVGDEITCIFSLPDQTGRTAGLRAGDRVPFLPPIGVSFVAWSTPEEVDRWIARRVPVECVDDASGLRHALAQTQKQGFHVTLRSPERDDITSVLLSLAASDRAPDVRANVSAFVRTLDLRAEQPDMQDPSRRHDLQLIASPVFHPQTQTRYNLCLGGFAGPLAGPAIAELGQKLIAACLEAMREP